MKVFINSSNLRYGGGITVSLNIINSLANNSNYEIVLIVPKVDDYLQFMNKRNVRTIFLPFFFHWQLAKPLLNYFFLPFLVFLFKPKVILSLGNIAFPSIQKQILLIHYPYLTYPQSKIWELMNKKAYIHNKLMVRFITGNLKFADFFFLQTVTMQQRFCRLYNISPEITAILPNTVSFTSIGHGSTEIPKYELFNNPIKLLFLSKYYPHKNFEILFDIASIIKENKLPIIFSLTIDKGEGKAINHFIERIAETNTNEIIQNIGHVDLNNISHVYNSHEGLFLPTILESFSGTYVEAMNYGKPIFTSNLDFARDVCKDAAFYFDPFDAKDILNIITYAFSNPKLIGEKIALGYKYLNEYKAGNDIGEILNKKIVQLMNVSD